MRTAIVRHRTERGPFKTWKEIAAVPGIDAKRVEEQKANLDFTAGLRLVPPGAGGAGVIGCGFGSASVSPSAHRIASKYICCMLRMSQVSDECANEP